MVWACGFCACRKKEEAGGRSAHDGESAAKGATAPLFVRRAFEVAGKELGVVACVFMCLWVLDEEKEDEKRVGLEMGNAK